jgi:hypothetical protein
MRKDVRMSKIWKRGAYLRSLRKREGRLRVMKLEKRLQRASGDEEEKRRKNKDKIKREMRSLTDSSSHAH